MSCGGSQYVMMDTLELLFLDEHSIIHERKRNKVLHCGI